MGAVHQAVWAGGPGPITRGLGGPGRPAHRGSGQETAKSRTQVLALPVRTHTTAVWDPQSHCPRPAPPPAEGWVRPDPHVGIFSSRSTRSCCPSPGAARGAGRPGCSLGETRCQDTPGAPRPARLRPDGAAGPRPVLTAGVAALRPLLRGLGDPRRSHRPEGREDQAGLRGTEAAASGRHPRPSPVAGRRLEAPLMSGGGRAGGRDPSLHLLVLPSQCLPPGLLLEPGASGREDPSPAPAASAPAMEGPRSPWQLWGPPCGSSSGSSAQGGAPEAARVPPSRLCSWGAPPGPPAISAGRCLWPGLHRAPRRVCTQAPRLRGAAIPLRRPCSLRLVL